MSRLSQHLGEGEVFKIGEEEITLKPLGGKYNKYFIRIIKGFSGAKGDDDMEGMFKNYNDETDEAMYKVVFDTLKKALPEESDEVIDLAVGKYSNEILPIITKLNGLKPTDDKSRAMTKLEEMRKARQNNG